jgi:hypothetical protein
MRIFDNSLTPVDPKMPDFKVSTQYYSVENGFDRLGMGREDEYFWKTAKEREECELCGQNPCNPRCNNYPIKTIEEK